MKIGVNTRLLLSDRLEGIGRFTFESFRRLAERMPEHTFYYFFDRPFDPDFITSGNIRPFVAWPPTRHPLLYRIWFDYRLPALFRRHEIDLFLSPDGILSRRVRIPQIPVIHDLNFLHRPEDLPVRFRRFYLQNFPDYAAMARRIITVSEFSMEDIARRYGIPKERIDVVYNGCSDAFAPLPESEKMAVRNRLTGGTPFFTYVGSLHKRKNIPNLLRAFDRFTSISSHPHKLVIVGKKLFRDPAMAPVLGSMAHRDRVVFTGWVPDPEMARILAAARAMVYIPWFEGFGIPLLEAMHAETPILASGLTSLPEVAGDAALYTAPDDVEGISDAMSRLAEDDDLCRRLVEAGKERRKRFSWDRTADLIKASIDRALG